MTQKLEASQDEQNAVRSKWVAALDRFRGEHWDRPDSQRFWSTGLDAAPLERLRELQGEKLRLAVEFAYTCIPFYRRRFMAIGLQPGDISGLDDLSKIPVTTKYDMAADLAENPPWGTFTATDERVWRERGWQLFASSGTTAQPRVFRYTALDRSLWSWTDSRALWAMGFRPGRDSALLAFGYGPHVWLWGVHYALNLMGIPIVTAGGLDSRTRARFIEQFKPTIVACTPSYAMYLGNLMLDLGLDPAATSVRYLFCAGEPGFGVPATRQRLEQMWNAEVHEFYGCTEAAPCAGGYSCAAVAARKQGPVSTHLMEDTHIWETVDPVALTAVPEGERGLSVVTNLVSEASPQLRFLVGDFTSLTSEACECGRTHRRAVGGFAGRADDMLNVRGVTLFPSAVEDAVRRVSEIGEEFLLVLSRRNGLDVLTVQVEPRPGLGPERHAEVVRRVETEIVSRCELRPVVELLPYGSLPKTEFKAKRVKDLRNQ
jgi:phenylacetate-CoA ligase